MRECPGLRNVFIGRSWATSSYKWHSKRSCITQPCPTTCHSFTSSISELAGYICAGQCLCHTTKRVKDYFEQENVHVMKFAAQSPDLNPI